MPTTETEDMIKLLAGSLTPATLAAVINDLMENCPTTDREGALHGYASERFQAQLVVMVGETEAEALTGLGELVAEQDACPKCGERNCDNLGWQDDDTTIKCLKCGTMYIPPALRAESDA